MEVHGIVRLDSITLLGQQITDLESPFHLERGSARLDSLRGNYSGVIWRPAARSVSMPRRSTALSLRLAGAQLEEYARTLPGRQSYRGARAPHRPERPRQRRPQHPGQRRGTHHPGRPGRAARRAAVRQLPQQQPVAPRFAAHLGQDGLDSADVAFRIDHGTAILDPIKFTGGAVSLQGRGTRDPLGDLDLRLRVLYGRDRFHLPSSAT